MYYVGVENIHVLASNTQVNELGMENPQSGKLLVRLALLFLDQFINTKSKPLSVCHVAQPGKGLQCLYA